MSQAKTNGKSAYTEEQLSELRVAFEMFDKDGSNEISAIELRNVMKALGHEVTSKKVVAMIKEVDENGNGSIDFDEFVTLMSKSSKKEEAQAKLKDAFKAFDKNKDGKITTSELRFVLKQMGQKLSDEEINDMMREADTNKNGSVDYQEFVELMTKKNKLL